MSGRISATPVGLSSCFIFVINGLRDERGICSNTFSEIIKSKEEFGSTTDAASCTSSLLVGSTSLQPFRCSSLVRRRLQIKSKEKNLMSDLIDRSSPFLR